MKNIIIGFPGFDLSSVTSRDFGSIFQQKCNLKFPNAQKSGGILHALRFTYRQSNRAHVTQFW